jgi:hypothetical protein
LLVGSDERHEVELGCKTTGPEAKAR